MVKLKIGDYFDEILCDIIPMDACHVLLGIPWEFDRKSMHDGYANTYSLMKDGVRHKLNPLEEEIGKVCNNARICIVDARKFLDGVKYDNFCFSFIPKSNQEILEDFPMEVVDLLHEFHEIISDNAPK